MKGSPTKLLLVQSNLQRVQKQGHYRLWLFGFISFLTLTAFATLLCLDSTYRRVLSHRDPSFPASSALAAGVVAALLHYSTTNHTGGMSAVDVGYVAGVLTRRSPCNFLVFGLNHESFLWKTLNLGGRTVFLDESEFWVKKMEERHRGIEAYDVQYTTKVADSGKLRRSTLTRVDSDCRPVQNLLFSDCALAINDLPNELYSVDWDVVLVDGPRGYSSAAPGRMSPIFTAAVLARSKKSTGSPPTDVFVHDFARDVERLYGREFLCEQNLVIESSTESLGHFRVPVPINNSYRFCPPSNRTHKVPAGKVQNVDTPRLRLVSHGHVHPPVDVSSSF